MKKRQKIVITGMANSGKTVLLTSLYSHLKHHTEEGSFQMMDKATRISKFCLIENGESFDFEKARVELSMKWPKKTKDWHTSKFDFDCDLKGNGDKKYRSQKVRVELVDFPGERLADIHIYSNKNYLDWSEQLLKDYNSREFSPRNSAGKTPLIAPYLQYMEQNADSLTENEIEFIHSYKVSLQSIWLNEYNWYISPSTFCLDVEGNQPTLGKSGKISEFNPLGIDSDHEFIPITREAALKNPLLLKKMKKNYRAYRNEIVLPRFDSLWNADALAFLISVPDLLNGGLGFYNGCSKLMENFFEVLHAEHMGKFNRFLRDWTPGRRLLKRVAFAGTMMDRMGHGDQTEIEKHEGLLSKFTNSVAKNNLADGVVSERFSCAACVSTKFGGENGALTLTGIPVELDTEELVTVSVPELPNSFPEDSKWPNGYGFRRFRPQMPERRDAVPKQMGLGKLVSFLIFGK